MRISNSKLDSYNVCGMKYKFKYLDNLKGNYTSSALLFGTAIDAALNGILEAIRDGKPWTVEAAKSLFTDKMSEWSPEVNRLDFFKGDVPAHILDDVQENNPDHWEEVWNNLVARGLACIDVYVKEVLPQIDTVISVQNNGSIVNDDGDEFVYVVDFVAKLKDGRTVLLDNKTASSKYPKNSVINSQQLSLYLESFPDIKYAGYIVLIKNPEKEKGLTHQIIVDEIPESTKQESFDKLETALAGIKANVFEKNLKSCGLYRKPCEYYKICRLNQEDPTLVPNRVK